MIKNIQNKLKNRKGFTLVELIIVIAIIAIIAAIAVPKFTSFKDKAAVKADLSTAKSIAKATELAIAEDKVTGNTVTVTQLVTLGYLDGEPKPQYKDFHTDKGAFTITITEGTNNAEYKKVSVGVTDGAATSPAVAQLYPTITPADSKYNTIK